MINVTDFWYPTLNSTQM